MECDTGEESAGDDAYFPADESSPQSFSQFELNDLVRDLYLSKQASELLASRLQNTYSVKTLEYHRFEKGMYHL